MVGDVTTRPASSYRMDGYSREKSTRSRATRVESSNVSHVGKSTRSSRGVLGSESEEDLVEARAPAHMEDSSGAEAAQGQGHVWGDIDGVEFVITMPSRSDKNSSLGKPSIP